MYPVEETVNSCFFNPNLGKSSRSLSSPGGLGRAQLLSVAGGYLPLGRAQDRRMSPELLAKVTRAWGLRTEFGSPPWLCGLPSGSQFE